MTQQRYISSRERVSARRVRKLYEYARSEKSLQEQLIERAIVVAERKGVRFHGACAQWLRELAHRTAARVVPMSDAGLAFNDALIIKIKQAFTAISRLAEQIAFDVKAGTTMSAASLQATLARACPLPPIC